MNYKHTFPRIAFLALSVSLTTPAVADEYAVWLEPGEHIENLTRDTDTEVVHASGFGLYHIVSRYERTSEEEQALLELLRKHAGTILAEGVVQSGGEEQCDEDGTQQCTIGFVDGTPTVGEYKRQDWIETLGILEGQALSTTTPVVVAVIDTGIDPRHPVFRGRLDSDGYDFIEERPGGWDLPNGTDDDGDRRVDEAYGHGTHIAGTILAVNPHARILSLRVADAEGNATSYDVARAIEHAIAYGADVINLSLSFPEPSRIVAHTAHHAVSQGIAVVTSAGNTVQGPVLFPGSLDAKANTLFRLSGRNPSGVITVAACDDESKLAWFSGRGAEVDLLIPGVDVYSAYPGDRWARWSGTSMATAIGSGIVSLVVASDPLPGRPAQELVVQTAALADEANPGIVTQIGWGIPNAERAVKAAR